ncbi:MAG: hypothetical protein KF691_10435 [Phycisphaeraceae bacterium]|nr:hypothetical protein [Phycisphaeraceae bacterium]
MEYVFISYASRSLPIVANIAGALDAIGACPLVYQRPNEATAVDSDTLTKIRNQIESSAFFIQVLDGSAGTSVESHDGTSILQLEMDWYLQARARTGGRRLLPHVVSFPPSSVGDERKTFDRYVRWFENRGIGYEPVSDSASAVRVALGWFVRHRYRSIELTTLDGSLDIAVGDPPVDQAIDFALVRGYPLPQKYLYTSPVAALLWNKLLQAKNSKTRQFYETIDYRSANLSGIKKMLTAFGDAPHTLPLSVIALGCGSGRRECDLIQTISRLMPHRKVRVLLVDVSKTLIAQAARYFSAQEFGVGASDASISFALADFEHPRSVAALMKHWSGESLCISLLFGNTLGNIDSSTFLQSISSAMKPQDILAVEIAIANENEIREATRLSASGRGWERADTQRDENFEFVCGPIRALGLHPKTERFRSKTQIGDYAVHKYYGYALESKDIEEIGAVAHDLTVQKALLQLIKVDSFIESNLATLYPSDLRIEAVDIVDCERVQKHGRSSKMGFVVAERIKTPPSNLIDR